MKTWTAPTAFENNLQTKIDDLKALRSHIQLGSLSFTSPLLLAPMSGICNAAFRLLMEDLGAGGSVSEFLSCHGINYQNKKTLEMLFIHPQEINTGIQLFGEDGKTLGLAGQAAQENGAKFIDINMGCPVKKVVTKGGGSALLRDIKKLESFFKTIKEFIEIPLTIKIRTGWDNDSLNANEVIHIAKDCGIEFVSIHGRTRTQGYSGKADWDYIESMAKMKLLPLIGNGDLHQAHTIRERLTNTHCQALMVARGCLRNPFIFLESFKQASDDPFVKKDYWEVIKRYYHYLTQLRSNERFIEIQLKKHMVWFANGLPGASAFRSNVFACQGHQDTLSLAQEYFLTDPQAAKFINYDAPFMAGGHG